MLIKRYDGGLQLTTRRRKPKGKQSRFISEIMDYDSTVSPQQNVIRNAVPKKIRSLYGRIHPESGVILRLLC